MPQEQTFPVQVLREHTVALEAALLVCLTDPTHKPVHRLRTETRRVEAQLLLLEQQPGLPEHKDEADRLRRALKRLRRAAGDVRDLDVQDKQLETLAAEPELESKLLEAEEDQPEPAVVHGAHRLRHHLERKRDEAAKELQKLLAKQQTKATGAAEDLLACLKDAEETALSAADLVAQVEALFSRNRLLADAEPEALSEDELHSVRKAAKASRYLAETLPGSAGAVAAAERFEALQQSGGEWHDALDLLRAAKRFLGKSHALTVQLAERRDRNLALYREALRGARKPQEPAKKTMPRSARKRAAQDVRRRRG